MTPQVDPSEALKTTSSRYFDPGLDTQSSSRLRSLPPDGHKREIVIRDEDMDITRHTR
jgi:hypothetical protein